MYIQFTFLNFRCLATASQVKVADDKKPAAAAAALKPNLSFVANMFRGEVEAAQLFPYPYALSEEQRENIAMFVDPVTTFFTVSLIFSIYARPLKLTITFLRT